MKTSNKVAVLDFGGQYSHLIVRRCRELGVYTELLPYGVSTTELGLGEVKGIILSGGPFSVHEPGSPKCSPEIFELGVPVLGICYGAQLIAFLKGGVVEEGRKGEFGRAELLFKDSELFAGVRGVRGREGGKINVWMSHGDVMSLFLILIPTQEFTAFSSTPRFATPRRATRFCGISCIKSAAASGIGRWNRSLRRQ